MRLVVFGADGRVGHHVVEQALGHGHDVRALVPAASSSLAHERLDVVRGDVLDEDTVSQAVAGCEAVVFALAHAGAAGVNACSEGIATVLFGMALHEVPRLVAVSAAGAFARRDSRLPLTLRVRIATTSRAVFDDLERMEQRIAASGVAWTIVRPAPLSDEPASGHYRIAQDGSVLPKMRRISRADVAAVALKAAETGVFSRRTLVVAG